MKYTVGQKLWWVPPYNKYRTEDSGGYEVTVTKVGIKYVTVDWLRGGGHLTQHAFIKQTGFESGGHSRVGRAWLTHEAYEANVAMLCAWRRLCNLARERLQEFHSLPVDMTMHEISIITGILETLS